MDETRIILSGLWVALMLSYLLGDVLRVFAGDFTAGEMDGQPVNQWMWVLAALVMLIPITMVVLSLIVPRPGIKWATIAAAVFLVLFNIVGLPYEGLYDNFLIGFGFVINGVTIYYAWTWI